MATHRKFYWSRRLTLVAAVAAHVMSAQVYAQSMREVLGAGDTVRISVFRYPQLSTEARLSENGNVSVPLLGEVNVKDMTPEQAGRHIGERLARGDYLVDPQVSVAVLQARSRQISVLGFVMRPGRYMLDGVTAKLSDVIALAGGLQPTASDMVTVHMSREGKTETMDIHLPSIMQGDGSKNIDLRSGDTVFVARAPMFYIYGEVTRAGTYRIEPGMTVMQAISVAGGLTPRGTDNGPKLRRRGRDGEWKETAVRLFDTISPDDVIFIRESLF